MQPFVARIAAATPAVNTDTVNTAANVNAAADIDVVANAAAASAPGNSDAPNSDAANAAAVNVIAANTAGNKNVLPRSCYELKATNPSAQSGLYFIDPDDDITKVDESFAEKLRAELEAKGVRLSGDIADV